jgi:hypothetical protein
MRRGGGFVFGILATLGIGASALLGLASSLCFDRRGESTLPCALNVARNGRFEGVELLR